MRARCAHPKCEPCDRGRRRHPLTIRAEIDGAHVLAMSLELGEQAPAVGSQMRAV